MFTRVKVAVFVDGCYWHRCPDHGTAPKHNAQWWREKLDRNVARDRDTDEFLKANGWVVIRIWEHEDPVAAADVVQAALRASGRYRYSPSKKAGSTVTSYSSR